MSNQPKIISRTVVIPPECSFHARPSALLVYHARKFACKIYVDQQDCKKEGESFLGLMMLSLSSGTTITLSAEGDDAELALDTLCGLIESKAIF